MNLPYLKYGHKKRSTAVLQPFVNLKSNTINLKSNTMKNTVQRYGLLITVQINPLQNRVL